MTYVNNACSPTLKSGLGIQWKAIEFRHNCPKIVNRTKYTLRIYYQHI